MNFNSNSGCGIPCPQSCPTYNCCSNVVNKCFVQEVPHYTNYHTHVVNNCIRRHVNIPTFSTDEEMVIIDEYAQAPMMPMPYMQQPMGFNDQLQNINPYQQGNQPTTVFDTNQTTININEGPQPYFNPNFNPYQF